MFYLEHNFTSKFVFYFISMLRSAHAKAVSGPGVTFLTEVRAFSGEIILRKIYDRFFPVRIFL